MRLKKPNKKSIMFFNGILVVVALVVLILLTILLMKKVSIEKHKEIGVLQADVLKEYQKGERVLMYIDSSARFSAYQSIYDLARSGGNSNKSECGRYGIYNLWTAKDKSCYPDDLSLKSNLSLFLNQILNPFLSKYEEIELPRNNYAFAFRDNIKIIGAALQNIRASDLPKEQDETSKNNIIYALNPSFDLTIEYSLNDYAIIMENTKKLIAKCSRQSDLQSCISDEIKNFNPGLTWSADCGTEEEKVFSEFLSYYQGCLASGTTDCSCEFKLKDGPKNKEFKIRFANDGNKIIATMENPAASLAQAIDALGPIIAITDPQKPSVLNGQNHIDFTIKYDGDGKPTIRLESEAFSGKLIDWKIIAVFLTDKYKFNLGNTLKMYKRSGTVGFSEEKIGNSCSVSERQANFCVTNNEKKVPVYDKIADEIKEKNVVYNFAIDFGDTTPPPPIENLQALDQPKAQNSVILTWDKIDEKEANDIAKYYIYYAKKEFKVPTKIENHVLKDENNDNVKTTPVDATKVEEEIENIDISTCTPKENELCVYNTGKPLKKETLYFWAKEKKFIYILSDLEDNEDYNIAVTAVDFSDNEIDGVSAGQELKTAQGKAVDDLEPGRVEIKELVQDPLTKKITLSWLPVTTNYDGTKPINDLKGYEIYYKKITAAPNKISDLELKAFITGKESNEFEPPDSGTYYFAAIAVDEVSEKPNKITELNSINSRPIQIPTS